MYFDVVNLRLIKLRSKEREEDGSEGVNEKGKLHVERMQLDWYVMIPRAIACEAFNSSL